MNNKHFPQQSHATSTNPAAIRKDSRSCSSNSRARERTKQNFTRPLVGQIGLNWHTRTMSAVNRIPPTAHATRSRANTLTTSEANCQSHYVVALVGPMMYCCVRRFSHALAFPAALVRQIYRLDAPFATSSPILSPRSSLQPARTYSATRPYCRNSQAGAYLCI